VVEIENKITEFLLYLEKNSEKNFSRWLTGVNIFEILGITSAEIRHSRILAWLLDPRESHNLGDKFFKKILMKVIDNNISFTTIKATEIILKDFSKAEVYRESKNNIDVLYTNKEHRINLVIENKTFTSDHDNQLKKYRKFIENSYVGYRNIYVYLTPNGDAPIDADVEEKKFWRLLSYQDISDILEELYLEEIDNEKVSYILKEYNDNIRRNILNDIELKELSAEIYFKYKEVLDLIFENRPDTQMFREKLVGVLNDLNTQGNLIFDEKYCSKTFLRFRTRRLDNFIDNVVKEEDSEWSTGSAYFYEITYSNFQADVYLSICKKNLTNLQSQKFKLLTIDKYSKYGFNTSNKFLNFDASEENLLLSESTQTLIDFLLENLQQIDEFEKVFIDTWNEKQKEKHYV